MFALLLQVCAGVAHAHRNLIIHCDIKPENVLVTADGTVKLLDFGIARQLDPAGAVTRNRPATPAYSSPEQLQGGALTTMSDVYSLGVLAYVVLTGQRAVRVALRSSRRADAGGAHGRTAARQPGAGTGAAVPRESCEETWRRCWRRPLPRSLAGDTRLSNSSPTTWSPIAGGIAFVPEPTRSRTGFCEPRAVIAWRSSSPASSASGSSPRPSSARGRRGSRSAASKTCGPLRTRSCSTSNDALAPIPGTTAARKLVVETALQYLDRLNRDGVWAPPLREELAAAYIRIGKVQGGAFLPNLGDSVGRDRELPQSHRRGGRRPRSRHSSGCGSRR